MFLIKTVAPNNCVLISEKTHPKTSSVDIASLLAESGASVSLLYFLSAVFFWLIGCPDFKHWFIDGTLVNADCKSLLLRKWIAYECVFNLDGHNIISGIRDERK